jgi:hypothetical protein
MGERRIAPDWRPLVRNRRSRENGSVTAWSYGARENTGETNYIKLSVQFSSVCFTLAMNWCATAPSTTR